MNKGFLSTAILLLAFSINTFAEDTIDDEPTGIFQYNDITKEDAEEIFGPLIEEVNENTTESIENTLDDTIDGTVDGVIAHGVKSFFEGFFGTFGTFGTKSIEEMIAELEGYNTVLDTIFGETSIENITNDIAGDSAMMQCVKSGIDFGNNQGLNNLGGLCNLFDLNKMNVGGFNMGDLTKCIGKKDTKGLDGLSQFCNGESAPSSTKGGIVSSSTTDNPNGWSYSTPVENATSSIDYQGIDDSLNEQDTKKTKERKFPSGLTGDEIYAKDGGKINKEVSDNPNSATSTAVKEFDKAGLVLRDSALKTVGSLDPTSKKLPLTKADAMDSEDDMANIIQESTTNFHDLIDQLVTELQKVFKTIEAENLASYYKKEKETFFAFISSNDSLKAHYTAAANAIKSKYSIKKFLATKAETYIDDPSEARASLIMENQRTGFRYAALLQQHENTLDKINLSLELKKHKELIDIAVRQAYVRASLFREDIAKKELDEMLKAVDKLIN